MSPAPRQRILYYCQSLVGIGHLTASLEIIKLLSRYYDIDLIYGGVNYPNFPDLAGFRVLLLPTLLFDESGELYSPDNNSVSQTWQLRQKHLRKFYTNSYHAMVFEFYPFGRRRFKKEIHLLIDQVRQCSGDIPIFSQVREILIPTDVATEQKIVAEIEADFHTVLVRGDPNIIKLDETFPLAPQLGDRLFYGGYISAPLPLSQPQRQARILVSQGGGNVGRELLTAAIETAPLLPVYSFLIATGSKISVSEVKYLHNLIKSNNVTIAPFLADFRQQLLTSALSINMGGDNTLLDAIATKTPSLAYPFPGNAEQALRIKKLAAQGWITQLDTNELNPEFLAAKIQVALEKNYPEHLINLNGAINICNKIREVLGATID